MRVSPVLVKRNCSVAKHLNQCTAATLCILKYNFMATAKILLYTHAATGCGYPALMYTKRNIHKI